MFCKMCHTTFKAKFVVIQVEIISLQRTNQLVISPEMKTTRGRIQSSVESQKAAITIQRCSVENQKGTIAVQRLWR